MMKPGRVDRSSDAYKTAAGILDQVVSGQFPDPSAGAVHFVQPDLQRSLGRRMPDWSQQGATTKIGAHRFSDFRAGEGPMPPQPGLFNEWHGRGDAEFDPASEAKAAPTPATNAAPGLYDLWKGENEFDVEAAKPGEAAQGGPVEISPRKNYYEDAGVPPDQIARGAPGKAPAPTTPGAPASGLTFKDLEAWAARNPELAAAAAAGGVGLVGLLLPEAAVGAVAAGGGMLARLLARQALNLGSAGLKGFGIEKGIEYGLGIPPDELVKLFTSHPPVGEAPH